MQRTGSLISAPQSFQEYASEMNLGNNRTAQYISINSFSDLHNSLLGSGYMVLRLGSPQGSKHTHFSLVKVENDWNDFFFVDKTIFNEVEPSVFTPIVSDKNLLSFKLFPKLTETSLVNLALATGLLAEALNIDKEKEQLIPATGQSTFTFDFQPLSQNKKKLTHNKGQVEIDSIFTGMRNGKECLFVMEAKTSNDLESLAKHKLFYPLLSIAPQLPEGMEIVPVYLRAVRNKDSIEFNVAECINPILNGEFCALTELEVSKVSRYSLFGYH